MADPKRLGKYQITKAVARGPYATVYLGHDPYLERPVALKVALLRRSELGALVRRFRRRFFFEAQIAGTLRHANILPVFDAGIDGDHCYIVMEYIEEGTTLKVHCSPGTLLPVHRAVEVVFKSARALDYAHRRGVIHCDIKPSNLLLTEDGEVKIADFGIAQLRRAGAQGGFAGSPGYMSPEQVQAKSLNGQTDIFSLGVVLYELLTGRHPFAATPFSMLVHRIVNEDPAPMSQYQSGIPPAFERVVTRALQKDRAKRYKSGADLASDLAVGCGHLGLPDQGVSIQERFNDIRRLPLFAEFSDAEVLELVRATVWHEFVAGDCVVSEGDIDDSFYVVASGGANVEKGGKPVGNLEQGDCFGELGYLQQSRRTASVVAASRMVVMKVNTASIEQASTECQLRFYKVFLKRLIRRLSMPRNPREERTG